jgi:16S rRNA (cytosine967-C5)-methyltransferase
LQPNAREVALQVLRRVEFDAAYSDLALTAELAETELGSADRRLATELVYGVLRHREFLDWHIDRVSKMPTAEMEPRVRDALRLGLYQLDFLDRVPAYAAVDQSVKLAPRRAAGLVNALLRRLQREQDKRPTPRNDDPLIVAAITHSHPVWLMRLFAERFGVEEAVALAKANQDSLPAVFRVNTLRATREDVLAELAELDVKPAAYAAEGIVAESYDPVLKHPAFVDGRLIVQSEASQLVGDLTGAQPGENVLDVCAAPGGKTTHLAALVGGQGRVVALDLRPSRLRLLDRNLKRLGLNKVATKVQDATKALNVTGMGGPFDRVLVDAPCSALGTLAKHPELKWRLTQNDVRHVVEVQRAILREAAIAVKPGGSLLFSVCTFTKSETDDTVERFLAESPEFVLDDLRAALPPRYDAFVQENGTFLSLPHRTGTEGMFAARFVRSQG